MRFLRVSLAALMVLAMVAGSALAADATTDASGQETTDTSADSTDSGSTTDTGSTTNTDSATAPSVTDVVYGDPVTVIDAVYDAKVSGQVLSITPPEGDNPGTITMLVAGQEITFTFTADMLEGDVAEGSYVEVKGTTQGLEKIEVSDEDEASSEFKTAVVGVTPATEGGSATITLMIGGQPITLSAEDLGVPADALELVTVGAEFKFETNENGETEMKISSESGEIKVEVKEDGTVEVKVETEDEENDKGEEISKEKKAEAEALKEEAKAKAEAAKEQGKKRAEESKKKAEKDDDDDDDDEDEEDEEDDD